MALLITDKNECLSHESDSYMRIHEIELASRLYSPLVNPCPSIILSLISRPAAKHLFGKSLRHSGASSGDLPAHLVSLRVLTAGLKKGRFSVHPRASWVLSILGMNDSKEG